MKKGFISTAIESLDPKEIEHLAIESGFQIRAPRKIKPYDLLHLYCLESINAAPSFNDIAGALNDSNGEAPSRQAVGKRINKQFTEFLQKILTRIMEENINKKAGFSANFSRVIVQDSTIIKLPSRLFEEFSGVSNAHAKVCNARIQGSYDLVQKRFIDFAIDPYSKNDLDAASDLEIREGDLILRDRGYQKMDEIRRERNSKAFSIHRHQMNRFYRSPLTDELIDLAKELKKNGFIDMNVCLNDKERTPVRLVTAPVDEQTANTRRRKIKKEIKGHNPSKKLLFLMSWTIFITNLARDKFTFKDILNLYGLRWRIESIFKTWKSNMSFTLIHNVSSHQLRAMIIARLITIVITMHCVYAPCSKYIARTTNSYLSIMKLMRYIQVKKERLLSLLSSIAKGVEESVPVLQRYCTYDKRMRCNFAQMEEQILNYVT